ncbi:hypothetical protein D3C80_955400 [compost metagenome]
MMDVNKILALKEFEDSAQATEVLVLISKLLECPAMQTWAKITDTNFNTNTFEKLTEVNQVYDEFFEEMDSAC